MKKLFFFVTIFIVLSSCSTSKSAKETEGKTATVEQIAANNFGENYKLNYNKSKKFVAITKKLDTEPYTLKIMVYDTKNKKILWGKKALKGRIEWISRHELQVTYFTKENKKNVLIYDTKTKQVIYK